MFKKKISAAISVLLCVLLGGGAGFLGGYYAKGSSRTIILQQTQTPTPKSTEQTVFDGTVFTQSQAGSDDPLTIAEIAAKVQSAVVEVTTETVTTDSRLKQYVSKGAGSGGRLYCNQQPCDRLRRQNHRDPARRCLL